MGHEGRDVDLPAGDQRKGPPGLGLRGRIARDQGDLPGHELARVDVEPPACLRDPEEDDRPTGADRVDRLGDRGDVPRGDDREVDARAVGLPSCRGDDVLAPRVPHDRRPEGAGLPRARGAHLAREHRVHAAEPEELEGQEPHRPRPEDDRGPRATRSAVERADRAREGLDEGGPLEVHGRREAEDAAALHVPPRDAEMLREPAGLEVRPPVAGAHRRAPAAARGAPPARDVMVGKHAGPPPDPLDALADVRDDAHGLVADHRGRRGVRAPDLLEVRPAEPARAHLHDDLARARRGDGHLVDPETPRPMEECGLHGTPPRRKRGGR